jgi:glycosyltransferase involved in cell wall biosynthesis
MITVVLNAFKRQQYLKQQINCVQSQTVPASRVLIWNNGEELSLHGYGDKVMIANNSHNLGVWSRFAYAINAETEYVCILDDDTFPAPRFFESCLQQMGREPALLGARGLRFLSASRYHPFVSFGWDAPNEQAEVVDIVGHAWFFKREWLGVFWRELPPLGTSRLVGEDMHFSFMLQKHLGIRTMVPPHPVAEPAIWGSDPELAMRLGTSKEAVSQGEEALSKFDKALRHCTSHGFGLCKDEAEMAPSGVVIGPGVTRIRFIKRLATKYPRLGTWGRIIQRKLAEKNIHI